MFHNYPYQYKQFLSQSDKQAESDWPHYSAKLEFVITYSTLTFHFNWYRKLFQMTNLYNIVLSKEMYSSSYPQPASICATEDYAA